MDDRRAGVDGHHGVAPVFALDRTHMRGEPALVKTVGARTLARLLLATIIEAGLIIGAADDARAEVKRMARALQVSIDAIELKYDRPAKRSR